MNAYVHKKDGTRMFTAALFIKPQMSIKRKLLNKVGHWYGQHHERIWKPAEWKEARRTPKTHTVWLHLYDIQNHGILIYGDKSWSMVEKRVQGLIRKRHEGTFWEARKHSLSYFEWMNDCTGVYNCENLLKWRLKTCALHGR